MGVRIDQIYTGPMPIRDLENDEFLFTYIYDTILKDKSDFKH